MAIPPPPTVRMSPMSNPLTWVIATRVVVGVRAKSVIVIIPAASATRFRICESGNLLRNNPFIMEMPFPVPVSFLLGDATRLGPANLMPVLVGISALSHRSHCRVEAVPIRTLQHLAVQVLV